jgi:lipoprotein-anchoring transpeptidase ErfK/SrfK
MKKIWIISLIVFLLSIFIIKATDQTNQRIYAYENGELIYTFLVSTGKWGRTPTGTFYIANKFRFVKMSGGSAAITPEAGLLYHWADPQLPDGKTSGVASKDHPGTKVTIYGTTPQS